MYFLWQSVCYSHPMELPSHDAGMEECRLPRSWKHSCSQTCTGEHTPRALILNTQIHTRRKTNLLLE